MVPQLGLGGPHPMHKVRTKREDTKVQTQHHRTAPTGMGLAGLAGRAE